MLRDTFFIFFGDETYAWTPKFTQTWNGTSWTPTTKEWTYTTNSTPWECEFTCPNGKEWDDGECKTPSTPAQSTPAPSTPVQIFIEYINHWGN